MTIVVPERPQAAPKKLRFVDTDDWTKCVACGRNAPGNLCDCGAGIDPDLLEPREHTGNPLAFDDD
ncbi:hypothetical protein EBS80_00085 [bacterium]|nr:hypothetical protein [bacterium]